MKTIEDYEKFVSPSILNEIKKLAKKLSGEHIVMVNSTPSGGGPAEMLNSLVLLMNNLGLRVGWRILKGSDSFFQITKEFHNALQSEKMILSPRKKKLYEETNRANALSMHFDDTNLLVIHDPQPLALIANYKKRIPWIWRCHVDLSKPDKNLLRYLKPFIERYDAMIVSSPTYRQPSLKINQFIIHPSIDPLTVKNSPLPKKMIISVLKGHKVRLSKPIISQIARFDKWKDPLGVVKVFKEVRKKVNCQLVLMGNMPIDDPEGPVILKEVQKMANGDPDIRVLVNCPDNDRMVNALQTVSKVVLQKSIKEGFALTVTEAMWKGTPVVGTKVGGIPQQIVNGKTGYLVKNNKETVEACLKLLKNKKLRQKLGRQAKEHVRKNFLITRHLLDYLRLFDHYLNQDHKFNNGFK